MMSRMLSAPEPHVVGHDVDVGVQGGQRLLGRVDLAVADAVDVVEDLALQIGLVDDVHVDDAEGADPGGRQVERGRRSEPARTEQQDLGVEQLELADLAHLGQEQVALVAVALGRGEGLRRRPGAAVVLPLVEPADQRLDVGVAEVAHGLGGKGRPHATGAVDDDRARLVGELALHLELEVTAGQVHRVGDGSLLVLVGLPDVEERDAALLEKGLRVALVHLADGRLGLVEKISGCGHCSNLRGSSGRRFDRPRTVKHYQRGQHSRPSLVIVSTRA